MQAAHLFPKCIKPAPLSTSRRIREAAGEEEVNKRSLSALILKFDFVEHQGLFMLQTCEVKGESSQIPAERGQNKIRARSDTERMRHTCCLIHE